MAPGIDLWTVVLGVLVPSLVMTVLTHRGYLRLDRGQASATAAEANRTRSVVTIAAPAGLPAAPASPYDRLTGTTAAPVRSAVMSRPFKIVSVFPDVLGTYGDTGNVTVLHKRLEWRDIAVVTERTTAGEDLPSDGDLYVIGGSEDDAQSFAVARLAEATLERAVQRGAHVFAVCAGLQMLGHSFSTAAGERVAGLGLLDLTTERLTNRVVGEVVVDLEEIGDGRVSNRLSGFANHGGGSTLGPNASPLGRVLTGAGNMGGTEDSEGAIQGSVVATYLHGPVLARNPDFADWLLERAFGRPVRRLTPGAAETLHAHLTA